MDLFRYVDPDNFLGGQALNGYDSVTWTERYRETGSVEIVCKLSSGLKDLLPEGTLVSHTRTLEIMMIENIQVSQDEDEEDPILTITGRELEAILDERVVGQNWNWATPPASLAVSQYVLPQFYTAPQCQTLINDHIQTGTVLMAGDAIPNLEADIATISPILSPLVDEERTIARGPLLQRVLELLAVDDWGLRVRRRGLFPSYGLEIDPVKTWLQIHGGTNRLDKVIFSDLNGDIDASEFLSSIKRMKNSALVTGKFVEHMIHGAQTGRSRRVMHVDGSDIDGYLEAIPTGGTLTAIRTRMDVRGRQALRKQKRVQLSRVDISANPKYEYRRDYDMGDLVMVNVTYAPSQMMRVVEYAEIEDENGESGHPTLELLDNAPL